MYPFFAYMSRLKLIRRWSLMRNTLPENDAEHSLEVAMIAHSIALIGKTRYGRDCDPAHIMVLAVYHDATEVLTGDLPTPVKYHSEELRGSYKQLEKLAARRLVKMVPADLQTSYADSLSCGEGYEKRIVKAADRISAAIKCTEEASAGNREFDAAGKNAMASLHAADYDLPEIQDFLRDFLPAFSMTLDELHEAEEQLENA